MAPSEGCKFLRAGRFLDKWDTTEQRVRHGGSADRTPSKSGCSAYQSDSMSADPALRHEPDLDPDLKPYSDAGSQEKEAELEEKQRETRQRLLVAGNAAAADALLVKPQGFDWACDFKARALTACFPRQGSGSSVET